MPRRALLGATNNELLTMMEVLMETGPADRDRLVHLAKARNDLSEVRGE
ncbi:MAG: hypothetical protein ACRDP9_26115 [Kribbellaceae bacterium]